MSKGQKHGHNRLVSSALAVAMGMTLLVGQIAASPVPPADTVKVVKKVKAQAESPIKLTASDGTGLQLVSYSAKALVNGPLAFTELHLTFQNPQERVLEGHFEITMPEKAAISRFAMKINEEWQEAEVVELQKARAAYEDFLHRRQDPALLEKQAGNQFQARVFPIPAKGRKEIIISYSQELTAGQNFRLPLQGLPLVENLSVRATAWQGPNKPELESKLDLQGQAPSQDFVVQRTSSSNGLVQGRLALLQIAPKLSESTSQLGDLVLLVDTSASRSLGYTTQLDKIEALLQQLAAISPNSKVKIAAFDQEVAELYTGNLAAASSAVQMLRQRKPLGATDLEKALAWTSRQKGYSRLLLITDGVDTCGSQKLKQVGQNRIDVILCGGIRKPESLTEVAQTQPTLGGLVLDGDNTSPRELARSLTRSAVSGIKVEVKGAKWVWPNRLDGLEPDQQRLVYAELPGEQQTAQVHLHGPKGFEKQDLNIDLVSVSWPLLARAASAAQIARLTQMLKNCAAKERASIINDIVTFSTKNRVLSDFTALLVLETDEDYARFGIDRTALADILTVGQQGLESLHRSKPVVAPSKPEIKVQLQGQKKLKDASKEEVGGKTIDDINTGTSPNNGVEDRKQSEMSLGRESDVRVRASGSPRPTAPADGSGATINERLDRDSPAPPVTQEHLRQTQSERVPRSEGTTIIAPVNSSQRVPSVLVAPEPSQPSISSNGWNGTNVSQTPAWEGDYAKVHTLILEKKGARALEVAEQIQAKNPGDLLALVALGEAYHATGQEGQAARAFGSLIDLFPGRADLRRYAGCQLESLGKPGDWLALDSYRKAVEQRPDHPSSYRLKAFALVKTQRLQEAFETLESGLRQNYPGGRFAEAHQVLGEDLAIVGRLWSLKSPARSKEISQRLAKFNLKVADAPSTRFVLIWETDANDVDFHILDSRSGHAFYSSPSLTSGGRLYADVTTGYGPECFNIPGGAKAGPYRIGVHYYARGPMGFGMGKVQILRHDGNASLKMEERPYVVMKDGAFVDLGTVPND